MTKCYSYKNYQTVLALTIKVSDVHSSEITLPYLTNCQRFRALYTKRELPPLSQSSFRKIKNCITNAKPKPTL